MDPLSVAASLVAVLGAAGSAARALQHVSDLWHAPDQLVALINEVADLQAVLQTATAIAESRTETFHDCESLAQVIQRASKSIADLNQLIHKDLVQKRTDQDDDSKPKASRKGFLRRHGKLKSMKSELQEIKLSLLIAIGTLTFADISRLKLRICDVGFMGAQDCESTQYAEGPKPDVVDGEASTSSGRCLELEHLRALAVSREPLPVSTSDYLKCEAECEGTSVVAPGASTLARSKSNSPRSRISAYERKTVESSYIRVEASVLPVEQCDRSCLCQCHRSTTFVTPNLLANVVGRLFVGYVGLPLLSYRKCDRLTCQNGKPKMRLRIAYLFPIWFALRLIALTITKFSTTFTWTLSFPVVVQPSTPMLVLSSLGSIEKIQALLAAKTAVLNLVDSLASKSPLHDCNNKAPLDTYYENYFTADTEEDRMTTLLPLFERHDIFDHWNLRYLHLIVLGCYALDLETYLTITTESIDVVDSSGRTALMWAAWRGDTNSLSTLLHYGANPKASSLDGNSVLIYATYGGSTECLKLLVNAGADVNHTSQSPVISAMVGNKLIDNLASAVVRVVQGAAVEGSRQQKYTPLFVAAMNNQIESLTYLLECGAETSVTSWNCSTPLSVCISFNNHRMVDKLIKKGADLNSSSAFSTSYLRCAAVFADERMMRLLSQFKPAIDIGLEDSQGCTAEVRFRERLRSADALGQRKEQLAAAFRDLVDVCSQEYEKARGLHPWQVQEVETEQEEEDGEVGQGHQEDIFHDALEEL